MAIVKTYTQARANLKALLDEVVDNREAVIIRRRKGGDVALIAADELSGLLETVHLLRSPNNARRLLEALERAQRGKGKPTPLAQLRAEYGLDDEE
jgi:antitoxin YefM